MATSNTSAGSDLNIILTGFMGTGKTSVARELAHLLGRRVIDLDTEIEKSAGMSITEIFRKFGEPWFRDLETRTARENARKKPAAIISTGGGVVLRSENMEALRESGIVFCLQATPETILKRTSSNNERPLLHVEDPLGRIRDMLSARAPFYSVCDSMIDTEGKSPRQIAEEILEKFWPLAEKRPSSR
ncbi:MAG: shikimate kinase [Nitrospiraceae bacterium]|nr:shikimate kinase [Nitrospiraceae bacterium]